MGYLDVSVMLNADRENSAPAEQFPRTAWNRLRINRQLLIATNSILIIVASVLLLIDYKYQIKRQLNAKRIALSEEGKTIYESLLAVESGGVKPIQGLVDNICARMNSEESPGHHIAAVWRGKEIQAVSHGQASPDMIDAMRSANGSWSGHSSMADMIVVGSFFGQAGEIFVSERKELVVAEAQRSLLMHVLGGLALALVAAVTVSTVLQRVISSPMQKMVDALRQVADGNLDVTADSRSCQEFSFLTDQFNSMTRELEKAEQDRRFHMEKARQIQQHLLPAERDWKGLRIASIFEPAEDIGGDYFDVLSISEHEYLVCIADVTGHGVPAAMAAAMIKTLTQQAIEASQNPSDVLARVNRGYTRIILPGHLATMVVVLVDTNALKLTYANAGHEPPLLQLPSGEVHALETSDLLLGVDDDTSYRQECIDVPTGGKIVLLSDGVTEAFDPEEHLFGMDRVLKSVKQTDGTSPSEVVARLKADLKSFRRLRPAFDDTTLVVAEIIGERPEQALPLIECSGRRQRNHE